MKSLLLSMRPHTPIIIICFLLGMSTLVSAQKVQSDYGIVKSYKQEVQAIDQAVKNADSVAAIDSLEMRISSLQKTFAEHRPLINKVIYPETFDEQVNGLKQRASNEKEYLTTLNRQERQLQQLNQQLATYSSRLKKLTSRTDSLQTAVQQTERSKNQLATEVEIYREQLGKRDELILSFIDSMIVSYQKLGVTSLEDIEETASGSRLNVEGNPLELILSITGESTELLQSNTAFTPEDYMRMKAVNKEFARMWRIMGEDLSKIYSSDPAQTQQEVLRRIHEWKQALDSKLWASLQQSFEQSGIQLSEFNSDTAFFNALNSYVNRAAKQSRENNSDEDYQTYSQFADFWNQTVKSEWTDDLTHAEILTSDQIAQIDHKLNQWASFAKPESNLFAYLLGGSLLAIAVLGFMLFQEKRSGKGNQADSTDKKTAS